MSRIAVVLTRWRWLVTLALAVWFVPGWSLPVRRHAPLDAAFVQYQQSTTRGKTATRSGHPRGYIPPPLNFSRGKRTAGMRLRTVLPTTFDWRTVANKLSPIRDQGPYGDCWAYAAYGSLESWLRPGEMWDFSENNMGNQNGFDGDINAGGNLNMATAYLARWSGPVTEAQDPFGSVSPTNLPPVKHVQEAIFLPLRASSLDNATIKQAVMTYGAVATTIEIDDYPTDGWYNSTTHACYFNGNIPSDHMVGIVGWDDNYPASNFATKPAGNGAFIVRNSWGSAWGEQGYCYISYYDKYIGNEQVAVFENAESVTNYAHNYQYDPFGPCTDIFFTDNIGNPLTTIWTANIFTASAGEQLSAFGIYNDNTNLQYHVFVYLNPTAGPVNASGPVDDETGTMTTAGYHTIQLAHPVALAAGQRFSIVVQATAPATDPLGAVAPVQYNLPGYTSLATGTAGVSFVGTDGVTDWSDTLQYDPNSMPNTMNCIKAFTTMGKPQPDLALCNYGEAGYTGSGVINLDGTNQSKAQTGTAGAMLTYLFSLKNTGSTADSFTLTSTAGGSGWRVQYVDRGTGADITTAMTGNGFKTAKVAAGATLLYTLHVWADTTVTPNTAKTLFITAASTTDSTQKDVVKAVTTLMKFQPDLALCNYGEAGYTGGGVINLDGTNQSKAQTGTAGAMLTYLFSLKNTGSTADSFTLTSTAGGSGWRLQYVDRGTGADITTAITGSGFKTAKVAAGTTLLYTLHIWADTTVMPNTAKTLLITAASAIDSTQKDVVKAVTTLASFQPDLSICNYGEASYTGGGIISLDGTGETKSQTGTAGAMLTYLFRLQNTGSTADAFTLTCAPASSGWRLQFVDRGTGADLTAATTGKGWTTAKLPAAGAALYTLHVWTDNTVPLNTAKPTLITAVSVTDATKKDAVKAVTTRQ